MAIKKVPKSGKWIAQIGSASKGTRVKRRFTSKKEAQEWLVCQQALLIQGPMPMATFQPEEEIKPKLPSISFPDAVEMFLSTIKGRTTRHVKQLKLDLFDLWGKCELKSLDEVSPQHLNLFMRKSSLGADSINTKIQTFKRLCAFLESQDLGSFPKIQDIPAIKYKARGRWALSRSECVELLEGVKNNSPDVWWPIFMTFLNTGVRRKELVCLEWSDLDFESSQIKIQSKPHIIIEGDPVMCKTDDSRRAIPMNDRLKLALQGLTQTGSLIFPTKKGTVRWNNFNRDFAMAMEGARIARLHELTPHILRHTFISHLLIYGKQDLYTVSKLAGHSSVKTTQIYLHLLGGDSRKLDAVNSLPDYEQK
jgi:integrase